MTECLFKVNGSFLVWPHMKECDLHVLQTSCDRGSGRKSGNKHPGAAESPEKGKKTQTPNIYTHIDTDVDIDAVACYTGSHETVSYPGTERGKHIALIENVGNELRLSGWLGVRCMFESVSGINPWNETLSLINVTKIISLVTVNTCDFRIALFICVEKGHMFADREAIDKSMIYTYIIGNNNDYNRLVPLTRLFSLSLTDS